MELKRHEIMALEGIQRNCEELTKRFEKEGQTSHVDNLEAIEETADMLKLILQRIKGGDDV
jgi:hypothetical protein